MLLSKKNYIWRIKKTGCYYELTHKKSIQYIYRIYNTFFNHLSDIAPKKYLPPIPQKNMLKTTFPTKFLFTFFFLFLGCIGFSQIALRGTATTGTSGGASLTINKPTGLAVGDIMIAKVEIILPQ